MLASRLTLGARLERLVVALVVKPCVWLLFIAAVFTWPILRSIRAERGLERNLPVLGTVRDFTLRDQRGGELGAELQGRLWVASFTTVACEPDCRASQRLMKALGELRHRTRNLGDAIRVVTVVVDAEHDATVTLSALSATQRASHGPWRFAAGPADRVSGILRDLQATEGTPQAHVALVDGNRLIRGHYDLADEAALGALLRDISLLLSLGG